LAPLLQVASLSGWLFTVIIKENDSTTLSTLEEDEATRGMFPLLKALGGLLMLPKDMLVDESVRGEVIRFSSGFHYIIKKQFSFFWISGEHFFLPCLPFVLGVRGFEFISYLQDSFEIQPR
jgi:hypothetical protein